MTLLEGDEREGVGDPDAKPTVVHGPVGDGVLTQVAVDHLRLDFQLAECLALCGHPPCHPLPRTE